MDLAKVKLKENPTLRDLARFRALWLKVYDGQRIRVDDVTARETFARELRKAPQMRCSLEHYDRMAPTDPDHSYQWLMDQLVTYLERKHMEATREQEVEWLENATRSRQEREQLASAGKGGGRGNGKGGKGNGGKGVGNGGRESLPNTNSQQGNRAQGGGDPPRAPDDCFAWLKYGSCQREQDCPFKHREKRAGTYPNGVPFPSQKGGGKGKGQNGQASDRSRTAAAQQPIGSDLQPTPGPKAKAKAKAAASTQGAKPPTQPASRLDRADIVETRGQPQKLCPTQRADMQCTDMNCPHSHNMTAWLAWRDYNISAAARSSSTSSAASARSGGGKGGKKGGGKAARRNRQRVEANVQCAVNSDGEEAQPQDPYDHGGDPFYDEDLDLDGLNF